MAEKSLASETPSVKILSNPRVQEVQSRTRRCSSACNEEDLTESDRLLVVGGIGSIQGHDHEKAESDIENDFTQCEIELLSAFGNHCHNKNGKFDGINKSARKKLVIASLLCLAFMVAEIVGGIIAHSLAIVSDAVHLLTDFASFMISLVAIYLATRQATKKLSFGWYRAEILGALVSILMLWVITGILVYLGVERIITNDFEINAEVMLITASCGVAFNLVLGCTLYSHGGHTHLGGGSHGHSHGSAGYTHLDNEESHRTSTYQSYGSVPVNIDNKEHNSKSRETNINVKAAFIHVIGDLIQSIGVLVAAFIIYFKPEYKLADPICTFIFSVIVLITTISIMREILVVLMEGTPKGVDFTEVRKSFFIIPGVQDIHNLRLWSLSLDKIALSVHIAVDKNADPLKTLKLCSLMVQRKFGITETTIQVEEYVEEMLDCTQCQNPPD